MSLYSLNNTNKSNIKRASIISNFKLNIKKTVDSYNNSKLINHKKANFAYNSLYSFLKIGSIVNKTNRKSGSSVHMDLKDFKLKKDIIDNNNLDSENEELEEHKLKYKRNQSFDEYRKRKDSYFKNNIFNEQNMLEYYKFQLNEAIQMLENTETTIENNNINNNKIVDDLKLSLSELINENNSLKSTINLYEQELSTIKDNLKQLKQKNEKMFLEACDFVEIIKQKDLEVEELKKLKENNKDLMNKNKDIQAELNKLESEKNLLKKVLESNQLKVEEFDNENQKDKNERFSCRELDMIYNNGMLFFYNVYYYNIFYLI